MGAPSDDQVASISAELSARVGAYGLTVGSDVDLQVRPATFRPNQDTSSAVAYFGAQTLPGDNIAELIKTSVPILPVVSSLTDVSREIPDALRHLNCLPYSTGVQRLVAALLECAGLLPKQRRVFISYKRDESRAAAVQLFDELSSRQFEAFLDTHGVAVGEDFQQALWHKLCDSDVLIMLDTSSYFASRWTSAEFGRALAKGISVLRVGWPAVAASDRTKTASHLPLEAKDIDNLTGRLVAPIVSEICTKLEALRSESHAVRRLNMTSNLKLGIERIGGKFLGVGPQMAISLQLPDGTDVVAFPTVGVPTSRTLHDALETEFNKKVAVLYDSVGIHEKWLQHLDWLGKHIVKAKWIRASQVAWDISDWGAI